MTSTLAAARSSKLLAAAFAACSIACAAACGGSGGSGAPSGSHPSATSFRPCTIGLSSNFAGNALETIARPQPPPPPAPPSPQPTVTILSAVQLTTSILTNGASFGGHNGLTQLHSIAQDSTALQTVGVVTDTFVSCPASNAGNYASAGWTSTDTNGVTLTVNVGAGNGLLDILPETSGATWRNSAAQTLTEVDADGQTTTKTTNADGSYAETSQFPDGTTTTVVEHSDGSASYSIPFGGPNSGPPDVINIGTPNPTASGGPVIPIVIVIPS